MKKEILVNTYKEKLKRRRLAEEFYNHAVVIYAEALKKMVGVRCLKRTQYSHTEYSYTQKGEHLNDIHSTIKPLGDYSIGTCRLINQFGKISLKIGLHFSTMNLDYGLNNCYIEQPIAKFENFTINEVDYNVFALGDTEESNGLTLIDKVVEHYNGLMNCLNDPLIKQFNVHKDLHVDIRSLIE